MKASKKIKEAIELADSDIRHHYELYAGEVRCATRRLESVLRGRIVHYKTIGRKTQTGRIEDVTEIMGCLRIGVICLPKRGGEGAYKELYAFEIVEIGEIHESQQEARGE